MKAILLNDTTSARHAGCELVMGNTLAQCRLAGIDIVESISFKETETFQSRLTRHHDANIVLINGEGTMHHDRPAALQLGRAARKAKQNGLSVVLFNTVWEGNQQLDEFLPSFDLIFCRESLSTQAIIDAGFHAETVPDMVFATPRPARVEESERSGIAVIDSVSGSLSKRLAFFSIKKGYRFLPISQTRYDQFSRKRILNRILTWRGGAPLFHWEDDLPKRLSTLDHVISGRFHGTCLSFLAGTPAASIASNSHKTRGLYKDIGLDPETIHPADKRFCMDTLKKQILQQKDRRDQIELYVQNAPNRIQTMFESIQSLP